MYRKTYGEELFNLIYPDSDNAKGREIIAYCEKCPERVYVCELDRRIVGFITFGLSHRTMIGEIYNNAVDPDYRGRGIGPFMYRYVFELFRKEGMKFAKVCTGLDYAHAPARRAYEKAGFNIKAEAVTYYMKL